MKKTNLFFGAVAALAMGGAFTACSDDAPADKGIDNGVAEYDQSRYINVTICSPTQSGSRLGGEATNPTFSSGDPTENYVNTLHFAFYDANGDWLYTAPFEFNNNINDDDDDEGTFSPGSGSVNKIWTSAVEIKLSAGQNMPSYVMAFVNALNPGSLTNSSIDAVESMQVNAVKQTVGTSTYYPMSNSVYYGDNPITGETKVRMVATPITTSQLYAKKADAIANPAIDIFVERYAAKINLSLSSADGVIADNATDADGDAMVNGYTLKFVPEYWRPNAIDENMYVLKKYAINTSTTATPNINENPTYSQLNNLLDWGWNDDTNDRSYWGCSPSYYAAKYPKVSDNIQDGGTYDLKYFSYKEIASTGVEKIPYTAAGFASTNSFYSRETTASAAAWKNAKDYNPVAVVSGAVIVGRYVLTPETEDASALAAKTSFWLYGKTNGKWNVYVTKANIINAMAANQNIVLDGTTHSPIKSQPSTANPLFTVEHPTKAVRDEAEATVAGRFVALQIASTKDDNGVVTAVPTGYCYYDATKPEGQRYIDITKDNVDKVNANLLTAGYATQYGDGLAYFNIPIQHLGFNTADYTDGKLDWEKARAGSFGLVRNHIYTINVESINGLATALRDEDQPIVPPADEQTYYISAKLNVLNWRIVPTQNVKL